MAQVTKNHRKMEEPGLAIEGFGDTNKTYLDLQDEPVALAVEALVLPCIEFGQEGRGVGVQIAMQCFAVWIAMQFVHASCLILSPQFQHLVQRSHRGGSTSRTKGSADISPRGRQSKRVKST